MNHLSPPAPLARVTGLGDYLIDLDLEDSTTATHDMEMRAELVNGIAAAKLQQKLAAPSDTDLIGGLHSATLLHAHAVRTAYAAGDAQLGALVRGLVNLGMSADANTEAEEAVARIEREARGDQARSHRTFRITGQDS
ncbi:hypothetical protein SAMN05444172_2612 [Burkholderia sp. GAS332]|nr:hypothetical protein SAMN05444172_2612 [Burkholderia sp. GAS332]